MVKSTKLKSIRAGRRNKHVKKLPKHPKKHHKPFRFRHLGIILLALFIGSGSIFQIGVYFGKSRAARQPAITNNQAAASSVISVRSAYGFSFAYDGQLATGTATEATGTGVANVDELQLRSNKALLTTTLKANPSAATPGEAAAQLTMKVEGDPERLVVDEGETSLQAVLELYPVVSDESFTVDVLMQSEERLSGIPVIKRVYQYSPKFGNELNKVYSVRWVGLLNGERPFSLHLQGLTGNSDIPAVFQSVFDTLSFGDAQVGGSVLGASTVASLFGTDKVSAQDLSDEYVIDGVSPAVVKIYHATCGVLVALGQQFGSESCDLTTGSGFFVASDGYIATNGHVVDYSAEDVFVNILLTNPSILSSFLVNVVGLSSEQIASLTQNPALFATLITEIYELPEDAIRLDNEEHIYFAALGDQPIEFESTEDVVGLKKKESTSRLTRAELIDSDYSSKDLYVVSSGDETGFSASDVALLRIEHNDTPCMDIFSGSVSQNMGISIVGFPGDAENALTDNSTLSTTVTNGSISAIRDSAGGNHTLYQSDADASAGNSGGPALSKSGEVIGLVTYRFKSESIQDAAKSYIRAIEDLTTLAKNNNVQLGCNGTVQDTWLRGLDLYADNHFSSALTEFEKVSQNFPAHRLAGDYIANAEKAIEEGRDVKNFPMLFVALIGIAVVGAAGGMLLVVRHHHQHQSYKAKHLTAIADADQTISSAPQAINTMPTTTENHSPTPKNPNSDTEEGGHKNKLIQ